MPQRTPITGVPPLGKALCWSRSKSVAELQNFQNSHPNEIAAGIPVTGWISK